MSKRMHILAVVLLGISALGALNGVTSAEPPFAPEFRFGTGRKVKKLNQPPKSSAILGCIGHVDRILAGNNLE